MLRLGGRLLPALALAMAGARLAASCEPCVKTLDLGQTAARADLIVVGISPKNPVKGSSRRPGPGQYEVRIERVLKGKLAEKKISVVGWQGMCSYGITDWSAKRQVLFLVRPPAGETRWHAVDDGCAVKALEMKGETVLVEKKEVPIGDFLKEIVLP